MKVWSGTAEEFAAIGWSMEGYDVLVVDGEVSIRRGHTFIHPDHQLVTWDEKAGGRP